MKTRQGTVCAVRGVRINPARPSALQKWDRRDLVNIPFRLHTDIVIVVLQITLVAGLAGFACRLFRVVRAWRRSKTAGRMMARTLRASVRNENAHHAIAVLREKRDIEIQPLESAMASRADLCQRIEGIRLRVPTRTAVSREAGNRRIVGGLGQVAGERFRVAARSRYSAGEIVDRRLVGHQG